MTPLWMGKAMGSMLGLMTGGPIGMMMGAFVGHWFDQGMSAMMSANSLMLANVSGVDIKRLFLGSMFRVMGRMAKLDGRVSEAEIAASSFIMEKMGLHGSLREHAIAYFREGKEPETDIDSDLRELGKYLTPPMVQMFLEVELTVAYADGQLSRDERDLLLHVCDQLGVSRQQFEEIHDHFLTAMRGAQGQSGQTLDEAYGVLGLTPDADADTLKRTYRKLMSQNHPDKLAASGLPDEMLELAKENTQKIQTAYDQIRRARAH